MYVWNAALDVTDPVNARVQLVQKEMRGILLEARALPEWMVDDLFTEAGNCLRALLVLVAGEAAHAVGDSLDNVMQAAISLELLYWANRLHDLLGDGGLRRRGAWEGWTGAHGGLDPVLLGDFLFTRGLTRVAKLPASVFRAFSDLTAQLILEKMYVRDGVFGGLEATEREYLERTYVKSPVILATGCKVGAQLGGCPSEVKEALTTYGYSLGMALQIQQDLQELTKSWARVGTAVFYNLHDKVLPLPVIHSLQNSSVTRKLLSSRFSTLRPVARNSLLRCLEASGSIAYTLEVARSYLNKARASLSVVPASEAKGLLLHLVDTLTEQMEAKE